MGTWVLFVGLAALFVGATASIVLAGAMTKERSQISLAMSAIEAIGGPIPDSMRREYDKPFSQRVGTPARQRMASIARSIAGANWSQNATRRLAAAGSPAGWDAERVLATKTLAAVLLAIAMGGVLLLGGRPGQALVWGGIFGVFGFFLPDLLLKNRALHRTDEVRKALPDSIDLLTVSVESGLAFDAALAQVARNTEGVLAEEFTRVLKEIQIGSARSEALRALSERSDVDELRIFLNAMIQAEKLGIPIADVLRVQTSEIRIKRTQRVEEQAMKLPVKILFPLMIGIMPAMFIVILGPAVMSIIKLFTAI